jgi:hypothetical protein
VEIHDRVALLEKQNRRFRAAAIGAAAVACLAAVGAAAGGPGTILAKRVELVDDRGDLRAVLAMGDATGGDKESAQLIFYHSSGRKTAEYDQMGLKYFHYMTGKETVSLRNFLGLTMKDSNEKEKISLWVNYDDHGVLAVEQ